MCSFLLSESQFSHLRMGEGRMPEVPLIQRSLWFQSLMSFPRKLPLFSATLPDSGGFSCPAGRLIMEERRDWWVSGLGTLRLPLGVQEMRVREVGSFPLGMIQPCD